MDDINWGALLEDELEKMQAYLDLVKQGVKKEPPEDAFRFVSPLRSCIYEAAMDVLKHRNKRIDSGDSILKSMGE